MNGKSCGGLFEFQDFIVHGVEENANVRGGAFSFSVGIETKQH
jgi:hypothetical protein